MGPPGQLEASTTGRSLPAISQKMGGAGMGETGRSTSRAQSGGSKPSANPFRIPADTEIFRLRDEERATKAATKAAASAMSVQDKSTVSSRMQTLFNDDAVKQQFKDILETTKKKPVESDLAATATLSSGALPARPARENIKDFLAKKREIFLVQMSLDTKRAEIQKLLDRARQREEALKKSEAMLEEDAVRFDAFLKENDDKVQEAIRRADIEAKAKQDKVMEIKRLNAAIASLRSELNKQAEQLEDCKRYKEFLESITPQEWFDQQAAKLKALNDERMAAWSAECAAVQQRKDAAAAAKAKAEADFQTAHTQQEAERADRAMKESAVALKEALKAKEPPRPDLLTALPESEEGVDMFFKEPQQLLQVFAQLEGANLFLIQNAQEVEEAAEEGRAKYKEAAGRLEAEVDGLQAQVQLLQAQVHAAAARAAATSASADATNTHRARLALGSTAAAAADMEEVTLADLSAKVVEVFARCGFDPDASLTTLQMLTSIEVRLEECSAISDTLPPELVADIEKTREKERRQVARSEKMAAAQREHEARVARALERAARPVFKKTGKPVMARSAPPQRKVAAASSQEDAEDAELAAFLARDLL